MEPQLYSRLKRVARRTTWFRLGWTLAAVWLIGSLIGLVMLWMLKAGTLIPRESVWWWLAGTGLASLVAMFVVGRSSRDLQRVAARVERKFPTLKQSLLTAASLRPQRADGRFGFLQRSVITEAVRHDIVHRWKTLISSTQMALAWLSNIPAIAALVLVAIFFWQAPRPTSEAMALNAAAANSLTPPIVTPGNTSVERGSGVIVTARFEGKLPDEIWLTSQIEGGAETKLNMRRSLNDPIFAAYLVDVREPLQYHIEYDGASTERFHVDVFEFPALVRADAKLHFPRYSQQDDRVIVDTRRVTVPLGTELTWELHLNKAVVTAELIDAQQELPPIVMQVSDPVAENNIVSATIKLDESREWNVRLVDADGRENSTEVSLRAKVLPNKPVDIKLTAGGDALVSPLEEFSVGAKIKDDFALQQAGITYQLIGAEPVEIVPSSKLDGTQSDSLPAQKTINLEQTIAFESLGVEPGQLLSYFVWAEDRDDEGELRRTVSDIYFVEVRPFDEIFREGQPPTEGQQQQQQQQGDQQGNQETEELLELQKQIMVGSWNVMRESSSGRLLERSKADVDLLAESQTTALGLLAEKANESDAPGAEQYIAAAGENMQKAIDSFEAAADSLRKPEMVQAMTAAQAAYQALLRLQSREHEVVQSRQQQSQRSSASAQARQQQINQLDLKNQENRYQEERLAQDEKAQEQSEMRQVISRLRELAARQEDINKQLREIEAALQAAEDEQERQDLEQQLERLREQQQQMLQDADELQQKLQEQSNPAAQDAQQQMEQARENLQQSSEALRQGNTSSALAAGTRAEEELKELQEEVRQQAANQFSESLTDMRSQAAELAERQDDIVDQMSGRTSEDTPGLRSSAEEQDAAEQLRQQQQDLNQLLEQMQTTVEAAEETEPLLAQRLYDSYRKTQQEQAAERLRVTEQLVERNLGPQARELAGQSQEDLTQLRDEIDEAAEAILGNEIDSMRRALEQLDTLTEDLDREIAGATGRAPTNNQQPNDPNSPSPASGRNPGGEGPEPSESQSNQPSNNQQPNDPGSPSPASGSNPEGEGQAPSESQSNQPSNNQQPSDSSSPRPASGRGAEGRGNPNGLGGIWDAVDAQQAAPLTGAGYTDWSDRLRDVEELVADPELRWQATQIRQAARDMRADFNRHAREPKWSEVEDLIAAPLRDLKRKVSDELIRRAAKKTEIVPVDRDPVPSEFSSSVRKYYQNLGSGN
ncbi:MAG: hypothetical protein R3C53_26485 [Pirellulaceae bacterium]